MRRRRRTRPATIDATATAVNATAIVVYANDGPDMPDPSICSGVNSCEYAASRVGRSRPAFQSVEDHAFDDRAGASHATATRPLMRMSGSHSLVGARCAVRSAFTSGPPS